MTRWMARIAALLLCTAWLGCVGAIDSPAEQASLLAPELAKAAAPSDRKRLFYIGLALYSESWSQNDVVELATELPRSADFEVVPLIASNFIASPRRSYPIADDATVAALVKAAAEHAKAEDVVLVHISTHGARGVLARKIGNLPPTEITASALARQLAPLEERRTVIILSACFSGSLIGKLHSPYRIIITAARSDRSSFGCAAGNRHTFFGEAELSAFAEPDRSLRQVFSAIRDGVARMEQEQQVRPSEPQVSVGADVTELYEAKLF